MAGTTESLSDTVKTLYERRLLTRALPRLVHGRFGQKPRWKGYGSYEVRRWASLDIVSDTLDEGNTPNEHAAPTITVVTMTPSWYGAWIKYTDKLVMTAFDPAVSEISALLGEQAGLSVDTLVRNAITANATKDYAGSATSRATLDKANDLVTFEDIVQNVAELETQNARPLEGPFYIVIMHPHTWATLMQDATFVTLFTREGGGSIRSGFVGTILNLKLYVTSNAREYVDGGQNSTEDVYSMLFIGREAYASAGLSGLAPNLAADSGGPQVRGGMTGQRGLNVVDIIMFGLGETGFDPLRQRGTVGWKTTHVDQILNSNWIRDLEHLNDFS
jgi:N4-gp56 family major capsid protein